MTLEQHIRAFLNTLPKPPANLILGVSGGVDSLSLLHALAVGRLLPSTALTAIYINHSLRPEAAAEASHVATLAQAWGVSFTTTTVDVPAAVLTQKLSVEAAARHLRYAALGSIAAASPQAAVAVAHTADDQAETVLMRFLRGSGMTGLAAMQPISIVPYAPSSIPLYRPLLAATRQETEAYCATHNITPMHDPSNQDISFLRNRLRHELLPILTTYNPQIQPHLANLANTLAADEALLQTLTADTWHTLEIDRGADWLRLDLEAWRALPLGLQRRTLRHAITLLSGSLHDLSFATLEAARGLLTTGFVGQQTTVSSNLTLTLEYKEVILALPNANIPHPNAPQLAAIQPLSVPGEVELGQHWLLTARPATDHSTDAVAADNPWQVRVTVENSAQLVVRHRRPGERFRPLGLAGHTKVKELMINSKIPAGLRAHWPIVADEAGVVWLVGHRIAARAAITTSSQQVIQLTVQHKE